MFRKEKIKKVPRWCWRNYRLHKKYL